MLLHVDGEFGIAYPTHVASEGFKRFSVAHELGHYRLPGHVDAVLDSAGRHTSQAGFRSSNRYEREADDFAAALLMPTRLFKFACRGLGDGVAAIRELQDECQTSFEATAIRYVQTSREPVAVIRSCGCTIEYASLSQALKEFPDLEWLRPGSTLPICSETAKFNRNPVNVRERRIAKAESELQDWFNGSSCQTIVEEVVGLGQYEKTLTLLYNIQLPEEVENDDEELIESWKPRFRR